MASTISVVITSDLSGAPEATTVNFGWNGRNYQIDLTQEEKTGFETSIQKYVDAAQIATGKPTQRASSRTATGGTVPAKIRAWASSNGVDVPRRGRIPQDVVRLFNEAHQN